MTPTYYVQHPDGSYSVADPHPQQDAHMQPAGDADMTVYRDIAANYHKDKADLTQQDAQAVPTQRQYEMALRQWDHWKSYALELQAKLVKYEGGSPMVLNAAPTPPVQRVALTDDEIEDLARGKSGHSDFALAVIEAYETKNGINRG